MKIAGRKPLFGDPVGGRLTLESLVVEAAAAARPPERLTVSEAAAKYRKLNNPGAYVGPWLNETTPYLREPMDVLQSLEFQSMVFAGPAQTGKTDMVLNWILYSAVCDPADMMLVQTSNLTARDFSMRRIDRLHRHSEIMKSKLVAGKSADNTFDKHYRSGMMLTLSWPSVNELSGKPIPRLWLTDYDRMDEDVDGEGNAFDLAQKRATTFKRYAMCVAESSPGFVVDNPKWVRKTRHEAPPTRGILALYNRGDRRRWYVPCASCGHKFEPAFELLDYPDSQDLLEAAEAAVMRCPSCNFAHTHGPTDHGGPGKFGLNNAGRWVQDGMVWTPEGVLRGKPFRSTIASFWMKGAAAAFSDWKTLVHRYLLAEAEYENTMSEEALKTTVNTDQGEAYVPKSLANDRVPESIKARARDYGDRVVPAAVRFLIATVDVQKNRFVVQIQGVAPNSDVYVIDRFEIKHSKRQDKERPGQFLWVNPGAYPEDWKLVAEQVLQRSYPLSDGSGRHMGIKLTLCDSGGKAGVTANAYNFVRWLRAGDPDFETDEDQEEEVTGSNEEEGSYKWVPGMAGRFLLVKGASTKTAPRVSMTYPDSQRKDRNAGARGEIPVLLMNTNMLKDMVDNRLDRTDPGGKFCFPNWLDDNFYIELTVEVKDPNKGWLNPKRYRNESWDLLAYCMAATVTPIIALDQLDMHNNPPGWAEEWDRNDFVFHAEKEARPMTPQKKRPSLAELAEGLA